MTLQKLKNKIIILSSLLFVFQGVFSQTIESVYTNMPDVLNPTLSKQNRLELLEYFKVGQSDSVTNRFGNQAYITVFDSVYQVIKVKNTLVSTFEIKLFNINGNVPIVGIISTVCAPVCQSAIQFYDTAWNVVPLKFKMPDATDWINNDSLIQTVIDKQWIKSVMKTSFITLSFGVDTNTISAKNNSLQFLSVEDKKQLDPFVNDQIFVYHLKDKIWVKEPN